MRNPEKKYNTIENIAEKDDRILDGKIGQLALKQSFSKDQINLAPDGYESVYSLSKKTGINRKKIKKIIDDLNIIGGEYRTDRGINTLYSPEQQQQLLDAMKSSLAVDEVPNGYLTVNDLSKEFNVNRSTITSRINSLHLVGEKYKGKQGKVFEFYSPEQQQQILDSLVQLIAAEEPPDGYITVERMAKNLGVSAQVVKREVEKNKINRERYKDDRGVICYFLSPEQQQQILDSLNYLVSTKEAPEGYLTIPDFAKSSGISQHIIDRRIDELGIASYDYKKNGNISRFLSPEQQQQILDFSVQLMSMEEVPDGYITAEQMAKNLGISAPTIIKIMKKGGLSGKEYRSKRGIVYSFLSPEQQQQILSSINYLVSTEKAPDGYLSVHSFSRKIGVSPKTVRSRINRLQLDMSQYRDNAGKISSFLSPEQQLTICENMDDIDYSTSIPENTVAFYLLKARQKIKQGIRPDWLKNPESGRNLEVDIFVNPPGIGIEYDGAHWHQDVKRDEKKDSIARKSGYNIIHIRENGCPEMPDDSVCIKRNNNDDTDLEECIRKCFEMLDIPVPDIDVSRDKKDIMAFMRQRVLDKLDLAGTFEELSLAS